MILKLKHFSPWFHLFLNYVRSAITLKLEVHSLPCYTHLSLLNIANKTFAHTFIKNPQEA